MRETILQRGLSRNLFVYAHIGADIIREHVAKTTSDAVVCEFWGAGTSAYKPLLPTYGGTAKWLARLATECGVPSWDRWCLTCWSAGGQVAEDVLAGPEETWPDAVVMLDATYGSKPPGSKPGDGRVAADAGLQSLCSYALAAAGGRYTMVLFHSGIATPYASTREVCGAIRKHVEAAVGQTMAVDAALTPAELDGHGFSEALVLGNLHIVAFPGIGKAEHITEAHLYDEVWRKWIPWMGEPAKPVLRRYAVGRHVGEWQTFLDASGFYVGRVDDDFGDLTEGGTVAFAKVMLIQSLAQPPLSDTGVVSDEVLAAADAWGFGRRTPEPWPPPPDFHPLVTNEGRAAVFGRMLFKADPVPGNPDQIKILGDWERKNLVRTTIPQLVGIQGAPKNGVVTVHRLAEKPFQELFRRWEAAGLLDLVRSFAGIWAPRFVRGRRDLLSNHAFATAMDINAAHNGYKARPPLVGATGSVRLLVPIANELGFYWGGHFDSPDGMHFELAVPR